MTSERNRMKVMVIVASTRPGRVGLPVGQWIADVARQDNRWDVTVADLKEIDLPMMDEPKHPRLREYVHEHTKQWSAAVDAQDAFIVVFPEYNHGFTAPLKNAIDFLSQEWGHKPVGMVSYGGVSGGLRAAQALKPVLSVLRMIPVTEAVVIPSVGSMVADGVFSPSDSVSRSADAMLDAMRRWVQALKPLRDGEIQDR